MPDFAVPAVWMGPRPLSLNYPSCRWVWSPVSADAELRTEPRRPDQLQAPGEDGWSLGPQTSSGMFWAFGGPRSSPRVLPGLAPLCRLPRPPSPFVQSQREYSRSYVWGLVQCLVLGLQCRWRRQMKPPALVQLPWGYTGSLPTPSASFILSLVFSPSCCGRVWPGITHDYPVPKPVVQNLSVSFPHC